jgi:hypothetical protein
MMTTQEADTQTEPSTGQSDQGRFEHEYLIILNQVIVATVMADCAECAMLARDDKYPGRQVGLVLQEDGRYRECVNLIDPVKRYTRLGWSEVSVRRLLAYRKRAPKLERSQ